MYITPPLHSGHGPSLFILMRHGESLMNTFETDEGRYVREEDMVRIRGLNDREIPLTTTGITQARESSWMLWQRYGALDLVFQSNALRSIQTADEYLKIDTTPGRLQTPLLNERSVGYLFGLTGREVERRFPHFQEHYDREGWFSFRPPGGESVCDVMLNRTWRFLEFLARECTAQRVLVCGHGRWMQTARILLENLPTHTRKRPVPTPRNAQWYAYRRSADGTLALHEHSLDLQARPDAL